MGAYPKHPGEVKLLKFCDHLKLDSCKTELFRDLMGWKYADRSAYFGIEPQVSARIKKGSARSEWAEKSASIAELLRCILGADLMIAVNDRPIQTLRSQMDLRVYPIAWLVAQLQIQEKAPEIQREIFTLRRLKLRRMKDDVVIPTLIHLVQVREQEFV